MSLINDALKKAQQARADQTLPPANLTPPTTPLHAPASDIPPPAPAPTKRPVLPPHPPIVWRDPNSPSPAPTKPSSVRYDSTPARKKSSLSIFWISLGAIAIIAISVRVTVMFTRSQPESAATHQPAAATQPQTEPQAQSAAPQVELALPMSTLAVQPLPAPATQPQPTATTESVVPTITFNPQPAAVPASTPPAAPTPAPATALAVNISVPAEKPGQTAAAPASAALPSIYTPRAPTPVNPGARIQSFIDRLRVTGIRMSNTGSKVILNDRLFKVGDVVDPVLELRLVKIEEGLLTFADTNGKTYIKLFQ